MQTDSFFFAIELVNLFHLFLSGRMGNMKWTNRLFLFLLIAVGSVQKYELFQNYETECDCLTIDSLMRNGRSSSQMKTTNIFNVYINDTTTDSVNCECTYIPLKYTYIPIHYNTGTRAFIISSNGWRFIILRWSVHCCAVGDRQFVYKCQV